MFIHVSRFCRNGSCYDQHEQVGGGCGVAVTQGVWGGGVAVTQGGGVGVEWL